MNKEEAKKRIAKLREVINYHRYLYHVLDKPEISDAALDSLKHELKKLEDQFPDLITPDSPTQRVGGEPLKFFKKVTHLTPMLSLEDVFSREEFEDWISRIQKLVPLHKPDFFSELKIDGFAISLEYENGVFVRGSTRGDGKIGEDVTINLKTIDSIPLKLQLYKKFSNPKINSELESLVEKDKIEVRGEVYLTKSAFEKINREQKKLDLEQYANPRNTAAGSIRQLDPKIAASRELDFLAYDLITDAGQTKHSEDHQILNHIGFKTDKYAKICENISEVQKFWQHILEIREKLPYQIDGIVVNVNDNDVFKKLGVVGKAPRGAIAYKFPAAEATTMVENIIVQVGRTGILTPVAVLRPVQIGGVTVSRATLHNMDEIKRLDVKIGDTVIVQRAGDVIPDIVKVLPKLRTGKEKEFHMPKYCPVCKTEIIKMPGKAAIYKCPNKDCPAIKRENLYHFVSRRAFDIVGLGPKIINLLYEEGLIQDAADLFKLKPQDFEPLERFAERSAQKLYDSIQKHKNIELGRFIYALGILHVGEETAYDLAKYFGSLSKIMETSLSDFRKVSNIGEVVAKSLSDWFQKKANIKFVEKLIKNGVKIINPKKVSSKLQNLTFVFTGELESLTRDQAQDKVRELGGEVSSSVSKETDYVVAGISPGSKYDKAKKLGVKIIDENEFLKMIK